MLVTRHRTGGFRQVVLRRGEFVFTRLTQGLPAGAPAAEVAAAIEREHKLSMGYMRRMSYSDDQGIDFLVVGAPDIGPALVDLGMPADQVHAIAPADAAACLLLADAAEPGDEFAEALHGAAFALKRRPVMALLPQELYEKRAGALVTSAAYAVIALIIGYASFGLSDAFLESQDIDRAYEQASLQTKQRAARLGAVADEAGDIQVSGPEVADTIALHDSLSAQAPSPLPLLALVGTALTPQTVIHKIDWEVGDHGAMGEVSLALTLHIDASVASVGDAIDIADAFAASVAERLPGLDVRVTDPPIDILPDQVLSGEIDLSDSPGDGTGAGYDAVISIFLPAGWPLEPAS
jgi:hypothetical protein